MTQLHEMTALEMARAVRRREVSPVELVEHALERADRLGRQVGAFITLTPDEARAQAGEAEARVAATDDPEALPALFGVPTAVKDLNLTAGVRTTLGSAAFADLVPPFDDDVVRLLREGGLVSVGKTTTPEFGLPCYSEPDVGDPARTPWDVSRSAGGSSGGAGAAVAAGIVAVAQGSDGGGSVRIPASVCGVFGIKPSRGRVSSGPVGADPAGLSSAGPLARTVRDAAALLDAMAVPQPGEPYWAPAPSSGTMLAAADREPGRLRVGRYASPSTAVEVHPDCLAGYDDAAQLLADLGHDVEEIPNPFPADLAVHFSVVWSLLAAGVPVDPAREHLLRPLTRWLRDAAAGMSGVDYSASLRALRLASRAAVLATAAYDVVLTPTLAQPPKPVGGFRDDDDPRSEFRALGEFTPFTPAINASGQPAVSIPLYWTEAGLPIGVQLVGRGGDEATLVSLSAQLEAARPWAQRHPPVW